MSRDTAIGVAALAAAVASHVLGFLVTDEDSDVPGFVITSLISAGVAALMFGVVIPRQRRAPDEANRAARAGSITAAVSVLSIPAWWAGLPFVLGPAAAVLGRLGRERAAVARRGEAAAALVLGVLVFVLAVFISITDEIG